MQIRLGLVELAGHNEVLWAYLKVFLTFVDDLHVFTSELNYDQLYDLQSEDSLSWHLSSTEDASSYLDKHQKALDSCDVLLFSTILPKDYQLFIQKKFKAKTIVVLHDLNLFLAPQENYYVIDSTLKEKLKSRIKIFRHRWMNEAKRNQDFAEAFDRIAVPSDKVKELNVEALKKLTPHEVHVYDFAITEEIKPSGPKIGNEIKIVIPGSISDKSRDYLTVLQAIRLCKDQINKKVELCLLGRPMNADAEKIVEQLKQEETDFLSINYYQEFIDQKEFDRVASAADFFILPVNEIMKISPVKERNGHSCVSGNINDMTKYQKPSLLPDYYPLHGDLDGMVGRYGSAEGLGSLITSWIHQREGALPDNRIYNAFSGVSMIQIREKFERQIIRIMISTYKT